MTLGMYDPVFVYQEPNLERFFRQLILVTHADRKTLHIYINLVCKQNNHKIIFLNSRTHKIF